jgi:hypothetical protein
MDWRHLFIFACTFYPAFVIGLIERRIREEIENMKIDMRYMQMRIDSQEDELLKLLKSKKDE